MKISREKTFNFKNFRLDKLKINMSLLNKLKKRKEDKKATEDIVVEKKVEKKEDKMSDLYKGKPAKVKEKSAKKTVVKKALGESNIASRVLVKPIVSEKASYLGVYGKYIFEVDSKSTKKEIKRAIRDLYGVLPIKVNIIKKKGRKIRYGRVSGMTKARKKAIVTLKPGDKIEVYEGV